MKKIAKWIKSWEWPDEISENVRSLLEPGQTLHICSGNSDIGDVKIDLDPRRADVQKGDMRDLQFETNTFDNVIIDPPWKLGYYQRFRPFYEAVRVAKIGGLVIYNATWIPYANNTELLNVYVRRDSHWGNVSVFSVFRKTGEDPERLDSR
jgi:hypothetical protein|tara:strand:+ start:80 stop:532 length:453 start_codon:yes stop_codon:yes gene_type:complete